MNPNKPVTEILNQMPREAVAAFTRANRAMKARLAREAEDKQTAEEHPTFDPENTMSNYSNAVQNSSATANTIDAGLQRNVIMKEAVRAFARIALPLRAFSTVFENVALQGTDTVKVPYYPLPTNANSSYDYTTDAGYTHGQSTVTQAKEIIISRRKYQPLDYSSQELRRQPAFDPAQLVRLAAETLAYNVLIDVLSCITVANFGSAVKVIPEKAITVDDLADIARECTDAHWPLSGRSLIVSSAYDAQLKKDDSIKLALNIAGSEVLREGRVPNIAGFDYFVLPAFPTNNENLGAIAVFKSAIGFVSAPVAPAPAVASQLYRNETVSDDATGISLSYRAWGVPDRDQVKEVIECAYGFAPLVTAALKRVCFA